MTPHLAARRALPGTAAIAAIAAVTVALGSAGAPTVALAGTAASVPIAIVMPLAVSAVVLWMLSGRLADHEDLAGLRVRAADAGLVVAAGVIAGAVVVVGAAAGSGVPVGATIRNTAGLVGIATAARGVMPDPAAAGVAPAYVLASMLMGQRGSRGPAGWAWVLARQGPVPALAAVAAAAAGMATLVARRPAR